MLIVRKLRLQRGWSQAELAQSMAQLAAIKKLRKKA